MNSGRTTATNIAGTHHRFAGTHHRFAGTHHRFAGAQRRVTGWLRHLLVGLTLAYILALSARLQAPVPLSPVPVTGQTFVVLLIGALLPRSMIVSTLGCYLGLGTLGLPYFAGRTLVGPTGGYLLGFVVCALIVNALMAKGWGRYPHGALFALLIGNALIYVVALPWLALFVGTGSVLALGFWPFVVGDVFKLICASGIVVARYQL
jgi:biotin transport system substrate-specific component